MFSEEEYESWDVKGYDLFGDPGHSVVLKESL